MLLFYTVNVGAISAKSAVVMDGDTGEILFSHNADQENLIASTTKIMTGLLTAESGRLAEQVAITAEMVGAEGSSMYLKVGEILTVEELFYGLMLRSGNDAAVALAVTLSGDLETFVEQMNQKALDLGLEHTHFANPHGLDDPGNFATATDLATLTAYALQNQDFRQVCGTQTKIIGERILQNHNKMLWRYPDAIGVKTGYTQAAGRILVTAAVRKGRTLVAVTMDDPDDWEDHRVLLDDGFSGLTKTVVLDQGSFVATLDVVGGTGEKVDCILENMVEYGLFDQEELEIIPCVPDFVFAPVVAGQVAGYGKILVNGQELAQVPLVFASSVNEKMEPPQEIPFWQRWFGG